MEQEINLLLLTTKIGKSNLQPKVELDRLDERETTIEDSPLPGEEAAP